MMTHILMSWFKESTERRKTRFVKETVKNVDLQKAVLNKTMTTQEYCVKYDFVAPLRCCLSWISRSKCIAMTVNNKVLVYIIAIEVLKSLSYIQVFLVFLLFKLLNIEKILFSFCSINFKIFETCLVWHPGSSVSDI